MTPTIRAGATTEPINLEDRVKVVYHPQFVDSTNPLLGMEYETSFVDVADSQRLNQGYTPLECLAMGVPAVTSNWLDLVLLQPTSKRTPKSMACMLSTETNACTTKRLSSSLSSCTPSPI